MLQQQKRVVDAALMAELNQLLLKSQRFSVIDAAEMEEVQDH